MCGHAQRQPNLAIQTCTLPGWPTPPLPSAPFLAEDTGDTSLTLWFGFVLFCFHLHSGAAQVPVPVGRAEKPLGNT